jgi:hypothetical protein
MIAKTVLFKFCCSFLMVTGSLIASAQLSPREKLMGLEKTRYEALTNRDTTTLSRILADDLVYIHTNGVVDDKSSLLRNIATGALEYLFILPEKSTATIEGNFGWVYGKANIRFRVADINLTVDQYISFIDFYRLAHNQWQLVACQNARLNKENPYFIKPPVKESIQPNIY